MSSFDKLNSNNPVCVLSNTHSNVLTIFANTLLWMFLIFKRTVSLQNHHLDDDPDKDGKRKINSFAVHDFTSINRCERIVFLTCDLRKSPTFTRGLLQFISARDFMYVGCDPYSRFSAHLSVCITVWPNAFWYITTFRNPSIPSGILISEWVTNVGSREESLSWLATSGRNSPTFQLRTLGGALHLLTLFGNANHREYKPINGARTCVLSIAVESVYDLHGDCDTFVPSNTGVTCITYRLLPDYRAPQGTFVLLNY